mgnify:CR=1 FL=1
MPLSEEILNCVLLFVVVFDLKIRCASFYALCCIIIQQDWPKLVRSQIRQEIMLCQYLIGFWGHGQCKLLERHLKHRLGFVLSLVWWLQLLVASSGCCVVSVALDSDFGGRGCLLELVVHL